MKKKTLIKIFLLLPLLLINPSQVQAVDNNDSSIPICNITMSGTALTPNSNPTIKPTQKSEDGKTTYFPFKACITDPAMQKQVDSCLQTGSTVKLSGRTAPLSWKSWTLSKNGYCFSTTLELKSGNAYDFNKMDIETEGGGCPKNTPLCRRVSADVDRSSTADNAEECQTAKDNFCKNLIVSPKDIVIDQPLTFNFKISSLLDDHTTCGTEYNHFTYAIIPPAGGNSKTGLLNIGNNTFTYTPTILTSHELVITATQFYGNQIIGEVLRCSKPFTVGTKENPGEMNLEDLEDEDDDQLFEICNQIPEKNLDGTDNERRQKCIDCFKQDSDGDGQSDGIWTAIGCIDTSSTENIVSKLMSMGISIAGGIALLMILASAFLFATSEGEPKRTSEAKEILTSAIVGLIFIIFSVTILEFIGVNILKIPGFGE